MIIKNLNKVINTAQNFDREPKTPVRFINNRPSDSFQNNTQLSPAERADLQFELKELEAQLTQARTAAHIINYGMAGISRASGQVEKFTLFNQAESLAARIAEIKSKLGQK